LILNGKAQAGKQRYKCKDCGNTKVLQLNEKYSAARRELVAQAYQERSSSRSVGRIFAISHRTVLNYLKKSPGTACFEDNQCAQ
jgi:transposase-like protein